MNLTGSAAGGEASDTPLASRDPHHGHPPPIRSLKKLTVAVSGGLEAPLLVASSPHRLVAVGGLAASWCFGAVSGCGVVLTAVNVLIKLIFGVL
jgi:hypothetical protein